MKAASSGAEKQGSEKLRNFRPELTNGDLKECAHCKEMVFKKRTHDAGYKRYVYKDDQGRPWNGRFCFDCRLKVYSSPTKVKKKRAKVEKLDISDTDKSWKDTTTMVRLDYYVAEGTKLYPCGTCGLVSANRSICHVCIKSSQAHISYSWAVDGGFIT